MSQFEFCISKHEAKRNLHFVLKTLTCLFLLGKNFVKSPLQTVPPPPSLQ